MEAEEEYYKRTSRRRLLSPEENRRRAITELMIVTRGTLCAVGGPQLPCSLYSFCLVLLSLCRPFSATLHVVCLPERFRTSARRQTVSNRQKGGTTSSDPQASKWSSRPSRRGVPNLVFEAGCGS